MVAVFLVLLAQVLGLSKEEPWLVSPACFYPVGLFHLTPPGAEAARSCCAEPPQLCPQSPVGPGWRVRGGGNASSHSGSCTGDRAQYREAELLKPICEAVRLPLISISDDRRASPPSHQGARRPGGAPCTAGGGGPWSPQRQALSKFAQGPPPALSALHHRPQAAAWGSLCLAPSTTRISNSAAGDEAEALMASLALRFSSATCSQTWGAFVGKWRGTCPQGSLGGTDQCPQGQWADAA